jgi:alpha-1,3-mannosyltransferase
VKVVHVVRQFSPSVGGLENSVLDLASVQRKRFAIDSSVVTLNRVFGREGVLPSAARIGDVPVSRIPWAGSTRYPLAPAVLARLQGSDIVHVHAVDFFFDFLALTAPLHGKALVASTHGGFFHTDQQAGLKKLWFKSVTRASCLAYRRIIACSLSDAEMFRPIAGEKLTLIENGIDQTRLQDAASLRQNRNIIYFGRFTAHKRIAAMFPLLRALRGLHPDWRLLIAGRESEQSVAELRQAAAVAEVADAVAFAVDPSDAQLRELIGAASSFFCLSGYEGFGLAAVEAMSAGLFPVLSDIAPFRRLNAETRLGLILPPDQLAESAAAIEASVLHADAEYGRRRRALMESVQRYDWEHAAGDYAAVYDAVVACRPAGEHLAFRQ